MNLSKVMILFRRLKLRCKRKSALFLIGLMALVCAAACVTHCTPFQESFYNDDANCVEKYLNKGGDPNRIVNTEGRLTMLASSAMLGLENSAHLLLRHDVDIDRKDIHGRTPLMLALITNHGNIAGLLLENGANIYVVDGSGNTLLHGIACGFGDDARLFQELVDKGLNPFQKNECGKTPIDVAIEKNKKNIIAYCEKLHH